MGRRDNRCRVCQFLSIITGLLTAARRKIEYSARHRADISSPMPAQFGFVAHSAERHSFKFASQSTRNRASRDVLPTPGVRQKKNRTFESGRSLTTAKILKFVLYSSSRNGLRQEFFWLRLSLIPRSIFSRNSKTYSDKFG